VVLYPGTRVGARVEIHAGSVLGSPGFGYLRESDGRQRRIPQNGWVEIEDDVEIGALAAIDRATFGATRIRRGAKLDNFVQVGHNSDIGEDCCLAAQVGVSGSVEVGARATLLGQVGVADHATLAPGAVVAAQSGVVGRIGPGEWIGYPAIPAPLARRAYGLIARLPAMFRELRRLRALLLERTGAAPPGDTADHRDGASSSPGTGGVD
jgi:UDP-3-O-[3-hydroxymyristoyl] glucosamine N-acyltransferase